MKLEEFKIVKSDLYLNAKDRHEFPANKFPDHIIKELKSIFWSGYKQILTERGSIVKMGSKEINILKYVFDWMICSPNFKGDLHKGLYIASNQGFGKDILLNSIVMFFKKFEITFKQFTFHKFCKQWFGKDQMYFLGAIKINDITGIGKMKRERVAYPFTEFLDYREQINNRRSIIVSTNFTPSALQSSMESELAIKRLEERIKECFNIVIIKNAKSKRIENKKEI